jgi:hypothetical protein
MATRHPSGTGRLRLLAAILLIGGPILALILRSWGVGSFVFSLGAILLEIRRSGSETMARDSPGRVHAPRYRSSRIIRL